MASQLSLSSAPKGTAVAAWYGFDSHRAGKQWKTNLMSRIGSDADMSFAYSFGPKHKSKTGKGPMRVLSVRVFTNGLVRVHGIAA